MCASRAGKSILEPLVLNGGEGGAVAPPAAIANAVCDALAPFGLELNATPLRPAEIAGAALGSLRHLAE